MRKTRKATSIALVTAALAAAIAGCGGGGRSASGSLTLKGSDTMVILGQRWAEAFMQQHKGTVIQVTGGGSGTGIAALINGTTDICQSSRPMKDDERSQIAQKFGAPPQEIPVAKDGLSVYLAETNPVRELALEQLKAIYTGQITNWKDVGGANAKITVYGRENSSGTYLYFKEEVLDDADFAAAVQTLPGTAAVVNAVASDPNGIGYGGAAYAKGVRDCAIKKDANSPAIMPSAATVKDGTYPISRLLYFYTRKAPDGVMKEFLDYVLSPEGQQMVTQVGYFPLQ
jgi:phosphate transport system substrate-binding protein